MKTIAYRLGWLLASNNGRCLVLWIITGILLIKAIFAGFGEPILTHTIDKKISESQSKYHQSVYDSWYHGEKMSAAVKGQKWHDPQEKQKPHSWSPWILFFFFFFISLIYTPIAFREEAKEAFEEAKIKIMEKEETEAREAPVAVGERKPRPAGGAGWKSSFTRLFSIDLLAEFAWNLMSKITTGMVRK